MIWTVGSDTWQSLRNHNLLMTGGTGFFGRSTLELIQRFNHHFDLNTRITVLTRNPRSFLDRWSSLCDPQWVSLLEGEITDFNFPSNKFDSILHFATPASATLNQKNPDEMYRVITQGTDRVLDFAIRKDIPKILFASSGAVYGKQPPDCSHLYENQPFSDIPTLSSSAYGAGKRSAETRGAELAEKHGLEFKIARCFAFVGPHLDPNGTYAIGNFIRDAILDQKIIIQGDGTAIRSYLYSDDLVLWLFKILLDGKPGTPYNVGSDEAISIRILAEKIATLVGGSISIHTLKEPSCKPPDRYVPSIHRARTELGLNIYTRLDQAISNTADRYRETLRDAR